ncbi:MAG TPA: hypothetical protein VMH80_21345 [Bryobacteraceae bacterium]|nr:hypothetical protein [Bryobacteraceae bacterium]
MYLFHVLHSFVPLLNPIGFGAADFIELILTLVVVALALMSRPLLEPLSRRLAMKTGWCMLLLAALPILLRLALLPQYPVPTPLVADDFSYLLSADTLRHFRLANPAHPLHQFFETFFVLQQPTYSSIFPLGQGMVIALAWSLFGHPWAGVALSVGVMCALCYWMLRAWTTPVWALIGGMLAVVEFGALSQWMNSYWGGAVSACAGCLVFGALPRLRDEGRTRDAALLGLGLGLQVLTRPYEFLFVVASVIVFFAPAWRKLARPALATALAMAPAFLLILFQNRAVTGSWTTLPYMLSRYQYGVPTTFTFQPNPTPHSQLTQEQQLGYEAQSDVHGPGVDSWTAYWTRWAGRIRFYRFFFLAPLYLALLAFLPALREFRFVWLAATVFLFSLGTNFYPYFYSHYIAALTCLFVLVSVVGLERLSRWTIRAQPVGEQCARILLFLCVAHFIFWYGLHASRNEDLYRAMTPYETWDAINHGDPEGRIAIGSELQAAPGKQLVFVRYSPQHQFQEWVYNAANIDQAPIVWARDLGPQENQRLLRYYPDRTPWLLEPNAKPPRLRRYPPSGE